MARTFGTYVLGPPSAPHITHDNGHLDKYKPRAPDFWDYAAYGRWRATLEAAEAAQGIGPFEKTNLPDALAAYRHFMTGQGSKRYFSYERYVRNDDSGKTTLQNQIAEAQNAALNLYTARGAPAAEDFFEFTGTALGAGNGLAFPYPATENWQKAIGAHNFWISGTLHAKLAPAAGYKGPANADQVDFELELTVHVEDMYNFNVGGAADIATGIPDEANGRFEITGLAQQYINWSEIKRTVSWRGTAVSGYSLSVGDNINRMRRERGPSDARRARDRR